LAEVSGGKPPFLETLWLERSLLRLKASKMASSACEAFRRSFKRESLKVGKGGSPGTWQWFRVKRVKVPPGKGVVNHPVFTSKSVTAAKE
jgi:hypothetical protein